MNFEFMTATQIRFGAGLVNQIGSLAAEYGHHALVVSGKNPTRAAQMVAQLAEKKIATTLFSVSQEPTIELAQEGLALLRTSGCDFVISLGGGSVLDMGKALAALATHSGHPLDYLEVIGQGQALIHPSLPFIAIPTTAGTGSEVTRNAVLASAEHGVKVSLRSPLMLPKLALIDPELTYDLPPQITASTGMDALTQVLEPFVSPAATPFTDAFVRDGLQRVGLALPQAYQHPHDSHAREDMALVSLFGGLALANAKLGAVHGFAAPLGGMFPAPHGAVCAALLPPVTAMNIHALQTRQPDSPALVRYQDAMRWLTHDPQATLAEGVAWLTQLAQTLKIPPLRAYGVTRADFESIAQKAAHASSMKGNPIQLTHTELIEILEQAF